MGQALYRKYRSKSLKEIVGQEHITQTLDQALKNGRISHAYLFTGPRGVGKTSIARILAHEINELPYTDDSAHIDIIEIDAASNRRIDEIRELREKVYVAPTSAKYKVYIIDEVHMLTREAFNALLKTLEEPPAHVVFILATTDSHKLPATIISRTQRFSFKPADRAKIIELLRQIASKEKIKISDEALGLIAEHSEGSFRDSVSLLDQARSHNDKVEADDIRQLLGVPPEGSLTDLINLLSVDSAPSDVMTKLTALYDQGFQAATLAKRLAKLVREQLVEGGGALSEEQSLRLLSKLIEVPASHDPERYLEIALLQSMPPTKQPVRVPEPVQEVKPTPQLEQSKTVAAETPKTPTTTKKKPATASSLDITTWPEVLQVLKSRHNTLYGVIRMAEPDFSEEGKLKLAFAFSFHQKRLIENSNQQKLADIIKEVTGQTVGIECLVDKAATPYKATVHAEAEVAAPTPTPASNGGLATISNIFGEAELLES